MFYTADGREEDNEEIRTRQKKCGGLYKLFCLLVPCWEGIIVELEEREKKKWRTGSSVLCALVCAVATAADER